MKKIAKVAMVASALFIPHVANAAPTDGTYTGTVQVKKGLTLTCTLIAVIDSGGTRVLGVGLSGVLCSMVTFNGMPYSMSSTGTTSGTFTVHNVDVNTITAGGCYGDVTGTYTFTTLQFNAVLPPKTAGSGSCYASGTITKQ